MTVARKFSLFILILCSFTVSGPAGADNGGTNGGAVAISAPNLSKLPYNGWSTEELVKAAGEGNFNAQMKLARDWILMADADDRITPESLEARHWSTHWLKKAAASGNPVPKLYLELSDDSPAIEENLPEKTKQLVDECKKLAEKGNIDAIQALGIVLSPIDPATLEQWYKPVKKKADAGNFHSAGILGQALLFGHATNEKLIAEGLKYAEKAAKGGDPEGMKTFGQALLLGFSGSDETERGLRWLNKAANKGHVEAMQILLMTMRDENRMTGPEELKKFKDREAELVKALCDRGHLNMLLSEGVRLVETGEAPLAGLQFLDRAANMGSFIALDSLAKYYQDNGYYVPANTEKAVSYAQRLADMGGACGLLKLASYHERGQGVPKNPERAYALVCQAKKTGLPDAFVEEARMIMKGLGTSPDPQKAFLILKKLSEESSPPMCLYFLLGYMYEGGIGTEQNLSAAYDLYVKGAEAGDNKSMNNLASMYETGSGTEKDMEQAKKWYAEAAGQGNEEAASNLSRIKETSSQ